MSTLTEQLTCLIYRGDTTADPRNSGGPENESNSSSSSPAGVDPIAAAKGTSTNDDAHWDQPEHNDPFPIDDSCLEGNLKMRKGRATGHGSVRWREHFVHLRFSNGGSLSVYEHAPSPVSLEESSTTRRHQSHRNEEADAESKLIVFIPRDLPWIAKDVRNSASTFAIEVPTKSEHGDAHDGLHIRNDTFLQDGMEETIHVDHSFSHPADKEDDIISVAASTAANELHSEMTTARLKGKPVRIYFKCCNGSNEKALWLDAFAVVNRLSTASRKTLGLRNLLANNIKLVRPNMGRARNRAAGVEEIIPTDLDLDESEAAAAGDSWYGTKDGEEGGGMTEVDARIHNFYFGKPTAKNKENKEFKVLPGYAYPQRWLSIREMYAEMMLPSSEFHDLRDPDRSEQELGVLRVEVLQCIGLPPLDMASDTDAVVYLVCGPHAFATDVIPDRTNPMWLRKTRRACIFPIYHGYARLFCGVFDDDGEKAKDDFAGRVVVDMARLRPMSTYDVLLPLRQSTSVYTRRPRGAIRLRFTLEWKNEKDVILSYIPKKIQIKPPGKSKPDLSTTIPCADPKAFRNVAITVHGVDMPGRFKLSKVKAAIKEVSFTFRFIRLIIQQEFRDTKSWINPSLSGFVFCAWMHCIYRASVGLVPGYLGIYILLQLVRTYAIFAIEGPAQQGFVAPTWEELLGALVSSNPSSSIEPLSIQREIGEKAQVKTHKPVGRFIFKCLGFIPWDDSLCEQQNLHLEFPFADGHTYEKFSASECLADIRKDELHNQDDDIADAKEIDPAIASKTKESSNSSKSTPKRSPKRWVRSASSSSSKNGNEDSENSGSNEDDINEDNEDEGQSIASYNDDDDAPKDDEYAHNTALNAMVHHSVDTFHHFRGRKDQDLDWREHKAGKSSKDDKLTHAIENVTYKFHSLTWHNFHDYVYDIKENQSTYFSESSKRFDKGQQKNKKATLNRKLNKLLGVREFSHVSSIVSKLGLFVEPFIGVVYGYLSGARAFFNLATWQDPYLTFLLSIAIASLTLVLFLIPWRPVLFVVGVWFVGPQNLVIRLLRERGILPPLKPKIRKEEENEELPPTQRSIFHSHKRLDNAMPATSIPEVDPAEVQHIVVPYGQLMYQNRFYDWPPEQNFCSVVPVRVQPYGLKRELSLLSVTNKVSQVTSPHLVPSQEQQSCRFPRLQRLRRRIRSKNNNMCSDELSRLSEGVELSEDFDARKSGSSKK